MSSRMSFLVLNRQCRSTEGKYWPQPVAWLHPFFVHYRTAAFTPAELMMIVYRATLSLVFCSYQQVYEAGVNTPAEGP